MPKKSTVERAEQDARMGKAPSTQAGEFVREEIEHVHEGKHGVRSPKQAIAIGLSKARRAGVPLPPPAKGEATEKTRKRATRDYEAGQGKRPRARSPERSRATEQALEGEAQESASKEALSQHARRAAAKRTPAERSAAAKKAARTRSSAARSDSAKKGAATRRRRARANAQG